MPKLTSFQLQIAKRNKQWNNADAAAKRVLLAREVLRLIKIQKLQPTHGVYTHFNGGPTDYECELQPFILDKSPQVMQCQCCAKGALFMAAVAYRNNCKRNFRQHYSWDEAPPEFADDPDQWRTIELYFEFNRMDHTIKGFDKLSNTHGVRANARLTAIMKNIIKNKGYFVPPPPLEPLSTNS